MDILFVPANQNNPDKDRIEASRELIHLYGLHPWILPKEYTLGGVLKNETQKIRNMIWFFKFEISFHEKAKSELEIVK